jgi:hypothetical protein
VGETLARRFDHIGGGIEADDARARIALTQDFGRIAGTAANVGGANNLGVRNSRHEIADGPGSLVFEFDILRGRPGHRGRPCQSPSSCDAVGGRRKGAPALPSSCLGA